MNPNENIKLFLSEVAVKYSLGEVTELKELLAHGDRKVYKIHTSKGVYIVKVASPKSDREKIEKDIYILTFLEENNFPSPRLLISSFGERLTTINEKLVYVYEFIEGLTGQPSTEYFQLLGKLIATLHTLPIEEYPYESPITPEKEFPRLIEKIVNVREEDTEKKEVLLRDITSFPSFASLTKGIIHTDLYFKNVITHESALHLIDFDDAGIAPTLIDVGYVIAHCCTTEKDDRDDLNIKEGEGISWHEEWVESFLTSYQTVRPLTQEEKVLLPAAARFGMLFYILDWDEENKISESRYERYLLLLENMPGIIEKL